MTSARLRLFSLIAMVLWLTSFSIEPSYALPGFGPLVDESCKAFNGTTPFQDQSCALCHSTNSPSKNDFNQNAQSFKNGTIEAICPATATAPVADAGPNQTVTVGTTVTLDGSKSTDSGGHALTYQWSLINKPQGSNASLSNATTIMPSFATDVAGSYVAQLIVNNGQSASAPDTVMINAGPGGNTAPVADAGRSQVLSVGATVTLDGSASHDADSQPLMYHWSLIAKPISSQATLSDPTNVRPTLVVDVTGEYMAQLIVNDGRQDSRPATVMVRTFTVPPKRGIHISRARWHADTGILTVRGRGPKNATVDIIDVISGASIGTATASDTGRFRFQATVTTSPCVVEAKSGELVSHKALVRGAGDVCRKLLPPKQPRVGGEQGDKEQPVSEQPRKRTRSIVR